MATLTLAYENNTNNFRDPLFSSYLNGESIVKPSSATTTTTTTIITPQEPMYLVRKKNKYGEISVFGAEKYFNGVMDEEENPKKDVQPQMAEKPKLKRGTTPSTSSEASWNSQSALLPPPVIQNRQEKVNNNGKGFFTYCKCYCSDNKSVDVDENVSDTKTTLGSSKKPPRPVLSEDCFTLPIKKVEEEDIIARKSLEVFGSPIMEKEEITLNIEKRLAMLRWDANPRIDNNSIIIPVVSADPVDDVDSDSSSDLFEIKSLSSNGHPFFRRQRSDEMSGCMSPPYEPSEASIAWSVVTASAANVSVAGDVVKSKTSNNSSRPKRGPGLLGCRSHSAVKVVGGAHNKLPEKKPEFRGQQQRSRFQAESKVTDLDAAQAQRAYAVGPFSSSPAADAIYIH